MSNASTRLRRGFVRKRLVRDSSPSLLAQLCSQAFAALRTPEKSGQVAAIVKKDAANNPQQCLI